MEDLTYSFTPKAYVGKPNATVFTLRELTIQDIAEIDDAMVTADAKGNSVAKMGTTKRNKFLKSVIGWVNLSRNGKEIPFSEENKNLVPIALYNEIVDEINKRLTVNEDREGE